MKRALVIILLLILLGFTSLIIYNIFLNEPTKPILPNQEPLVGSKSYGKQQTIAQLAELKGRAAGSIYEKKAATLIAKEFVNLDLQPLPNKKNYYFQTFMVPKRDTYYLENRLRFKGVGQPLNPSQNVFGFLPGKTNKVLLFTAHYDGQGINNGIVYPSANDNLSGVYVLLKVAEELKKRPKRNLSYLFIAFGAEEIGLIGSDYFLSNLPIEKDTIIGAINFDTVSTYSEKMLIEAFDENSIVQNVEKALANYNFGIQIDLSKRRTSDHYHFSAAGLEALTIAADDWLFINHTPEDTFERLNFTALNQLSKAIIDMALTMDEHEM